MQNRQSLKFVKCTQLFTTNDKVNEHNDYYLQHFDTDHCICEAVDYTIVDVTANAKQTVLNIVKDLPPQKTQNGLRMLQIKLSVHYLVVVNIDTSDGLTNGATGILQWFDSSSGKPHTLWVQFRDTPIWKKIRIQYKHLYTKNIDKS